MPRGALRCAGTPLRRAPGRRSRWRSPNRPRAQDPTRVHSARPGRPQEIDRPPARGMGHPGPSSAWWAAAAHRDAPCTRVEALADHHRALGPKGALRPRLDRRRPGRQRSPARPCACVSGSCTTPPPQLQVRTAMHPRRTARGAHRQCVALGRYSQPCDAPPRLRRAGMRQRELSRRAAGSTHPSGRRNVARAPQHPRGGRADIPEADPPWSAAAAWDASVPEASRAAPAHRRSRPRQRCGRRHRPPLPSPPPTVAWPARPAQSPQEPQPPRPHPQSADPTAAPCRRGRR